MNGTEEKIGSGGVHQPRWRQIQRALEDDIRNGVVAPGERLPTESALAKRFGVHRNTVRRAIERLRQKRLIRVEQGSGTFVQERSVHYAVGRGTRLTTAVRDVARSPSREVLSCHHGEADDTVGTALRLPSGFPVLHVETLRRFGHRPVAVSSYVYPLPRFEGIDHYIRESGSISASMRHFGVTKLLRQSLRIRASTPSVHDAELLGVGRSKPLINLIGVSVSADGSPVQFTHSRFISAWLDLVFEFEEQTG
ncbi:MAG: phosphonate metabolism transcriptional regulator PhnF [Alphaproteobacteria bacterium]|nr:phosphonate metabolism transcriptional regulator PhnF [Alphaproteobacteria bacterium]